MRLDNWEIILYDYIQQKEKESFEWGKNDCVLFVTGYLDAVTGSNLYLQHVNNYTNEEEANSYLAELGFISTEELATAYLMPKSVKLAQRGDIVMLENGALGICDGRRSYFFAEANGLIMLPTLKCRKAWSF